MRRTILVVDEIAMFRDLEALFLSRLGRVVSAASGREALERAHAERPDVIVTDLGLPDLDGVMLCRAIHADPGLSETPVLVLTASPRSEDRERVIRAGAADVLPKPIDRVALLEAVRRLLQQPGPRGQPRIELRAPAQIRRRGQACWGTIRNLSRGGAFIECSRLDAPRTELALELHLPETHARLASTAEVVWTRSASTARASGMGLRFLAIDGASARSLADYIHERLPPRKPLRSEGPQ